jgi:transcriptional regulator with XRE-family HTH domain
MELGKKIRSLRLRAGLTQEQLAEKLSIGPQSVSKWENLASMPDITLLPAIAEIFGVTIDDLFDLSTEQRLNRIENRMDIEAELMPDVFTEYEEFLKSLLQDGQYKKRATELISYLYWHRMNAYAKKVSVYAREAIRMAPSEKTCTWQLAEAEHHAVWDWNLANHTKAIDFYKEVVSENPEVTLPLMFLIDNLIADHRTDEAESYLMRYVKLKNAKPVLAEVYRAHIALARFDEPTADSIIEGIIKEYPENVDALFEAAQYYAMKCDYDRAIKCYELSFEKDKRRPRFQDALMGISDVYRIKGDYRMAEKTYGRIVDLLRNEWGITESTELDFAEEEKARLALMAREAQQ